MNYSLQQFEQDVQSIKPRFFDTYLLAPFMIFYAAKYKAAPKNLRRILFASGIYMLYRNYQAYKQAALMVANIANTRFAATPEEGATNAKAQE
jgi:hypothetical protein